MTNNNSIITNFENELDFKNFEKLKDFENITINEENDEITNQIEDYPISNNSDFLRSDVVNISNYQNDDISVNQNIESNFNYKFKSENISIDKKIFKEDFHFWKFIEPENWVLKKKRIRINKKKRFSNIIEKDKKKESLINNIFNKNKIIDLKDIMFEKKFEIKKIFEFDKFNQGNLTNIFMENRKPFDFFFIKSNPIKKSKQETFLELKDENIANISKIDGSFLGENINNISKDFSEDFNFPNSFISEEEKEEKIKNVFFKKLSLRNLAELIEIEFEKKKKLSQSTQNEIFFSEICKNVLPFFKGHENKVIPTIFLTVLFISNEKNLKMTPSINKDFSIIF